MSQRRPPAGDVVEESPDVDERISSKVSHMEHPQPLSDSENEEPGRYRSAFVSKNNAGSFPSLTWSIQSKPERSQSCIDTANDGPPPTRRRAAQSQKPKVPCNVGSLAAVTGVLLSTENSRSFSAPVLTSERRLAISSLNSFTPLHKPERSISPESNDSISEELNHFKPIVCSPCTPPKRLPDGRVLSPVIVKSTPRNLRRNLQKPTSYEASPVILKKWEQVFRDRQMKRTLSKGTLTTEEGGPDARKAEPARKGGVACKITFSDAGDMELPPSCSKDAAKERPTPCGDCDGAAAAKPIRKTIPACVPAKPMKATLKRAQANGSCFSDALGLSFPPRRGQKRRCKTKHLEQNGGPKRPTRRGGGYQRMWRDARLRQEDEDKKLAAKLQQIYDKERRRVSRRHEYPLRSKSAATATAN